MESVIDKELACFSLSFLSPINWVRLVSYMDYFFNNKEEYVGNKYCKTATS